MTTIRIIRRNGGRLCLLGLLLAGCDESEDERISKLDSLRIVAVRSDLPYAAPSETVMAEMLVVDGSPHAVDADGNRRSVRLLWMGSCVNPTGDLYYNCFPQLHESLKGVTDEEIQAATPTDNTQTARLGFESSYRFTMPSDVTSSRPSGAGIISPYGTVFLFYAACAGELRIERKADVENDYPIGCYDPNTGKALGQSDFEFGFYPIYAYETLRNANPLVSSVKFAAKASGAVCTTNEACTSGEACSSLGTCIPKVKACKNGGSCKTYRFEPVVDRAGVEKALSARVGDDMAPLETLWVSYYADLGELEKDARIFHEATSGFGDDYSGAWTPRVDQKSFVGPREAHVYAVVRDSRGGVTWVSQYVSVE